MNQFITVLDGLAATGRLARQLGRNLKGGEVIVLSGDLGSGKTTLVKGLALGADSHDHVTSPSFTIRNDYQGRDVAIAHFDFYRLLDAGIVREMLAEAVIDPGTTVVIEWAGVVDDILPIDRMVISLKPVSGTKRSASIDYPERLGYLLERVK